MAFYLHVLDEAVNWKSTKRHFEMINNKFFLKKSEGEVEGDRILKKSNILKRWLIYLYTKLSFFLL